MAIGYRENALTAEDFLRLRASVGWSGQLRQSALAIERSMYTIAAFDGEMAVGMGRLVGDGALIWYVQDVVVDPAYQGKGVGKAIMERLLAHIKANSVPGTKVTVSLMAAIGKHPFYEKFGFAARPNDHEGPGMNMRIDIHKSKNREECTMEKKLRVAIIGTGGIAHSHMRAYLKMKDVQIVGGADIVPGKARKFFDEFDCASAKDYEDPEKMLRELKPDAVSVCTYNSTHAECSIAAMEAGCDVLCEKPMSILIGEAKKMLAASEKTGKILSIGFQPRYDPNMKMIKHIIQSGTLGKVYYIQTGGGRRRGIPGGTFINKELAGVGALADIGCYALDMALNSIGYPKPLTVSATATSYFGKNPKYYADADKFGVDDFSAAFIRLEGDITLDFRMSWAMHMNTTGDTIFLGTDAGLKVKPARPDHPWGGAWDGTIGPVFLYSDVAGIMSETAIPIHTGDYDRFYDKVRAFVEAVQTGGEPPIPASQIIYNQAIIDGIIRSSESGHEVEVEL